MNGLIKFLNEKFAPAAAKINKNTWVNVLKDSVLQTLPFILVSSLVSLVSIPGNFWKWWPDLSPISNFTFGLISIYIAFLVPFNLMERKKLKKQRLIAGLTSIALFLMMTRPEIGANSIAKINFGYFGAGGMFVAMIGGVIVGLVMEAFGKFSFFSEDTVIPDFVTSWFDSMLPITIIIVLGWVVIDLLNFDLYNFIVNIFKPLSGALQTLPGFMLIMVIFCFFYSMGISSWVFTPIVTPLLIQAVNENAKLVAAGKSPTQIVTYEVIYVGFLWWGGVGCTMPLNLMMLRAKSQRMKALGKACILPAIFNINEPTVFGTVVWNPYLMLPMWLNGLVLPAIVWIGLKLGITALPSAVNELWYIPFPIGSWLVSPHIGSIILVLIVFAASALIWYPFFKIYDNQQYKNEQAAKVEE